MKKTTAGLLSIPALLGWFLLFSTVQLQAHTLQAAVNLALTNNQQLAALEAGVEAADRRHKGELRRDWPLLTADAGWQHQTEVPGMVMSLDDIPPPIGPLEIDQRLGTHDSYSGGLQLGWLAFSGFARRAEKSMSRLEVAGLEQELVLAEQEIALQTVRLYRGGQLLQLQRVILLKGRERVLNNLGRLRQLIANRMLSAQDTLDVSAALNQLDRQLLELEREEISRAAALELLTGESILVESFDPSTPAARQFPQLRLEENPSLVIYEKELEILDARQLRLNSLRYPRLQLFAGWRWGRPGLNQTQDEWMDYGIIGAQASWTLWDGGVRKLGGQSLQAAATAQQKMLDATRRQLSSEYEQLCAMYHIDLEQLQLMEKDVQLTQYQLQGLEAKMEQGTLSGSELRDQLLELVQVETEVVIMQLQLLIRRTEIEKLSGLPSTEWSL